MLLAAGCTTRPGMDWNDRVGSYTFDQAVMEMGPPDKSATLSDGSKVTEWLTRRGDYGVHSFGYGYGYHGRPYRPYGFYSGFAYGPSEVSRFPDRYIRLVFDPEGKLKAWKDISR